MNVFHSLMNKLDRYRLIPDRLTGADYMHRYYLFLRDRANFPYNVTLHHIVKSDEPILHDHPWPYMTIILRDGYWETTKNGKFWRRPGYVGFRSANNYHRVDLKEGTKPMTIFIPGPFGLRKGSRSEYGIDFKTKK